MMASGNTALMKTQYNNIPPYVTKDGSIIRELMHPDANDGHNQSLAEAIIPVGVTTRKHLHHTSEEIYHVTQGEGCMRLGDSDLSINKGDTIVILPGTIHNVTNSGRDDMYIMCSCSPAYSHDDTELVDEQEC